MQQLLCRPYLGTDPPQRLLRSSERVGAVNGVFTQNTEVGRVIIYQSLIHMM